MHAFNGWITVGMAHFGCRRYIRRAVDSLLAQTYPWVRVVVVNDADPNAPWPELADIQDPRLVRFDLPRNGGSYFCLELVRLSSPDPYFMMQDADDWADPDRAGDLLAQLLSARADLAVSAQPQFTEDELGHSRLLDVRWASTTTQDGDEPFVVRPALTPRFRYRVPHHGLARMDSLAKIGGYYGGFRVGWDTYLTNIIMMIGSVTWTPRPLYFRLIRGESLTHSDETGVRSEYARGVSRCLHRLYEDCYGLREAHMAGRLDRGEFESGLRRLSQRYVSPEDRQDLDAQAERLRAQLAGGARYG